jgi:AcrR family transcriptional regulator
MKTTKDEIVAAARHLFRERGFAGTSMQDLADRVGLKKASLYSRFASKEALVTEVLELALRETLDTAEAESEDWWTAYSTTVNSIASVLVSERRCVAFHLAYGVTADTPLAKRAVQDFFLALRGILQAILSRGLQDGEAERTATDAIARLEGATLWLALLDDDQPMVRALAEVLKMPISDPAGPDFT